MAFSSDMVRIETFHIWGSFLIYSTLLEDLAERCLIKYVQFLMKRAWDADWPHTKKDASRFSNSAFPCYGFRSINTFKCVVISKFCSSFAQDPDRHIAIFSKLFFLLAIFPPHISFSLNLNTDSVQIFTCPPVISATYTRFNADLGAPFSFHLPEPM